MTKEDHAKSHMSGGRKKSSAKKGGKKHVHHMHIRHAANGGHIVEHFHEPDENGETMPPEEHILPGSEGNQMLGDHVTEHMAPPEVPMAAPAGGTAPAPAPGPAAPPMGA